MRRPGRKRPDSSTAVKRSSGTELSIPGSLFDRLEDQLRLAGLHDAFPSDTEIDLTGVVLVRTESRKSRIPKQASSGSDKVSPLTEPCLACGSAAVVSARFGSHLKKVHGLTREQYHLQYVNPVVPKCARSGCGNDVNWDTSRKTWRKYCSRACLEPSRIWMSGNTIRSTD